MVLSAEKDLISFSTINLNSYCIVYLRWCGENVEIPRFDLLKSLEGISGLSNKPKRA